MDSGAILYPWHFHTLDCSELHTIGQSRSIRIKNSIWLSICDGLGTGAGFTIALTLIGLVRELLGAGSVFDFQVYDSSYAALLFILAPGAFIILGLLIALFNRITNS